MLVQTCTYCGIVPLYEKMGVERLPVSFNCDSCKSTEGITTTYRHADHSVHICDRCISPYTAPELRTVHPCENGLHARVLVELVDLSRKRIKRAHDK